MSIDIATEKRFESDIEAFFLSDKGGYINNPEPYDTESALYKNTFIKASVTAGSSIFDTTNNRLPKSLKEDPKW